MGETASPSFDSYKDEFEYTLEIALSYGITEFEFWNMTYDEVKRAIRIKQKVEKIELRQRAIFDYKHAQLVSIGFANKLPEIWDMYPTLFNSEEEKQKREQQQAELFARRFRQFAESHNRKIAEATK